MGQGTEAPYRKNTCSGLFIFFCSCLLMFICFIFISALILFLILSDNYKSNNFFRKKTNTLIWQIGKPRLKEKKGPSEFKELINKWVRITIHVCLFEFSFSFLIPLIPHPQRFCGSEIRDRHYFHCQSFFFFKHYI